MIKYPLGKAEKLKAETGTSRRHIKSGNRDSGNSRVDRLLFLQKTIGNRAVQRMIDPGLNSQNGIPGSQDKFEHEAEGAADAVMRVYDTQDRSKRNNDISPSRERSQAGTNNGNGRHLSGDVREKFEQAFGWDFSRTQLHTGAEASKASESLGASAFTTGNDIFFGRKINDPESAANRRLLAHELAHVVQQEKNNIPGKGKNKAGSPAASLSSVSGKPAMANPVVTGLTVGNELGVGQNIRVTARIAPGTPARTALTWSLVGAPAGVTITPAGRNATIRASAAAIASAGAAFNVRAALTSTPGDDFSSPPITLVGITGVTFAPAPAFLAPVPALIPATGAANTADPNRGGLVGNTANVNPVFLPALRPAGSRITFRRSLGATVAGNVITPAATTGNIDLRVTDTATGTFRDATLPVNPVPLRLSSFPAQAGPAIAGVYGVRNTMRFTPSHTVAAAVFNRIVGETITAGGRDDFGLTAIINTTGPNPAPVLNLAVPANSWTDQLYTSQVVPAGATPDNNLMNVNRYVGPGVAAGLPRVWILRQGFHFISWAGNWGNEFDHGIHRRSLIQTGPNAFGFRSEHIFPGARAAPFPNPYVSPYVGVASPLINLSAVTAAPLLPAAARLAADGVATAGVNVVTTHAGRNVRWSVLSGPIAFTVPLLGAVAPVGTPATVRSGLVPGRYRIRVEDAVFPNRRAEGVVTVVPVVVRGLTAPVRRVPAGTLVAAVNVTADPGGRTINWTLDPAAVAAGVTVAGVPVAGVAAAASARGANVTRPGAFRGTVTVTAADSVRPASRASITLTFL